MTWDEAKDVLDRTGFPDDSEWVGVTKNVYKEGEHKIKGESKMHRTKSYLLKKIVDGVKIEFTFTRCVNCRETKRKTGMILNHFAGTTYLRTYLNLWQTDRTDD